MKTFRKFGLVLSLFGMLVFISHVEHEGHEHSKSLKDHDCICHTIGMVSAAAPEVACPVTLQETLKAVRRKFECEISPLFLNAPRAPPAATFS